MPTGSEPARPDALMATVQRLAVSMDALAAVGASLRIDGESIETDPEIARLLGEITAAVPVPTAPQEERQAALGFIRAFFRQASDLLEDPGRAPGWSYEDPVVLQGIGRGSGAIAGPITAAVTGLGDLSERLQQPGAAILDVGAGVGWLAIELARAFPAARVTGLDIWEPALALAHRNVEDTGLGDRVEVRRQDVTTLGDAEAYDLAWLASPFLPVAVVPPAIARCRAALRPGSWMVLGLFAGPDDPLAALLADLRTVRSGGHPWTVAEATALAEAGGLEGVHEIPKTWGVPARLVVGRRSA